MMINEYQSRDSNHEPFAYYEGANHSTKRTDCHIPGVNDNFDMNCTKYPELHTMTIEFCKLGIWNHNGNVLIMGKIQLASTYLKVS